MANFWKQQGIPHKGWTCVERMTNDFLILKDEKEN